jgi:hypothetical protein
MSSKNEHGGYYSIRIREKIDGRWSDWFEDLQIDIDTDGTVLTGRLADQAALHGVIARVQRLGLHLEAVNRIEDGDAA